MPDSFTPSLRCVGDELLLDSGDLRRRILELRDRALRPGGEIANVVVRRLGRRLVLASAIVFASSSSGATTDS